MYKHSEIEKKWQKIWEETNAFETTDKSSKKFYVLDMFPYPSGSGLHVGHPEGYTATDIIARYKRLNGYDVLHPIGWDAFGLPAEQYALQTGNKPDTFTQQNIAVFRKQLKSLGFSYDYAKEIDTTDPQFFRQTQWIFTKMYEKGLAEIREIDVNWCAELGTVLANEEVIKDENGNEVSERGGFPVIKKPMKQWVLKITNYAKELHDDLAILDWPSSLIKIQKNWIYNEDGSLNLRDWVFSRQRYWGEPFPIAFDEEGQILVIDDLPVLLPKMEIIKPSGTGEAPLANAKDWLYFEKDGKHYRRETNTMPQWAGSSWYYLAYILKNGDSYLDLTSDEGQLRLKKWLPVDVYIGGQEHATLHLLYARFWHKVLFDIGVVPTKEPFQKVVNQGMILGLDGQKMSKSRGNVINPTEIVDNLGADTLRVYEMFMGPLEERKTWSTESINGIRKWIERVFRIFENAIDKKDFTIVLNPTTDAEYHKMLKGVNDDIANLRFNVAISKMMVFINVLYKEKVVSSFEILKDFAIVLSLFAPHVAEELLEKLGEKQIKFQTWPNLDETKIVESNVVLAIQINGKLRTTLEVSKSETKEEIFKKIKNLPQIIKALEGQTVKKEIYIPLKIVNFVV